MHKLTVLTFSLVFAGLSLPVRAESPEGPASQCSATFYEYIDLRGSSVTRLGPEEMYDVESYSIVCRAAVEDGPSYKDDKDNKGDDLPEYAPRPG